MDSVLAAAMESQSGLSSALICGFILHPGRPAQPLPLSQVPDAMKAGGLLWLHFNLAHSQTLKWIGACETIPRPAFEILSLDDRHIRLEISDKGLSGILGDLHYDFKNDPEDLGLVRIYLDERCVITGRTHPLKAMDRMRVALSHGKIIENPFCLLVHLVELLADDFESLARDLGDEMDEMEDSILKGRVHDQGGKIALVRRLTARVRRHVHAEKQVLLQSFSNLPGWCSKPECQRLRKSIEKLEMAAQDVELVQERARLLQEEIANRVGEATNRNLYVLSTLTALFLPITLVTGIFGMNVPGLPWLENPMGFVWVMAVMALVLAVTLAILRRKGLI